MTVLVIAREENWVKMEILDKENIDRMRPSSDNEHSRKFEYL